MASRTATLEGRKSKVDLEARKSKLERNLSSNSKLQSQTSSIKRQPSKNAEPTTMAELLAQMGEAVVGFKKGDVVTGTVSSISGKEVLINFGGKMEGVVGEKEWDVVKDFVAKLSPGDKVEAVIISPENDRGQMVVSIKRFGSKYRWKRAEELLTSGEAVAVRGAEVNKGGLVVEFEGIRGFVPGSQLSAEHQAEIAKLVNRTLQVKVIEVDEAANRLIFSEKAVTGAADLARKLETLRSMVKIGEKYPGKVAAIMNYGVFVSLSLPTGETAEGLVHISEVSWSKVEDLSSLFKVGDEVEVMVIGISETDAKLNLSIKQLLPDPWLSLAKKYSTDQQTSGKVTRVSPYGIFVQLDPSADGGIEGLIHISKVPPEADYKVGDSVTCTIESVDAAGHRISLIPVLTAKPIGYK